MRWRSPRPCGSSRGACPACSWRSAAAARCLRSPRSRRASASRFPHSAGLLLLLVPEIVLTVAPGARISTALLDRRGDELLQILARARVLVIVRLLLYVMRVVFPLVGLVVFHLREH